MKIEDDMAFLRGINIGGQRQLIWNDLRKMFFHIGFNDINTINQTAWSFQGRQIRDPRRQYVQQNFARVQNTWDEISRAAADKSCPAFL